MKNAVVIGLGIGMAHVQGYLESPDVNLIGVCDLDTRRTDHVGGTFDIGNMLCLKPLFDPNVLDKKWEEIGVKVYSDIEEVMNDENVHIVSICTPDYLHPQHLKKALENGKNILLEKPIAIDLETANILRNTIKNPSQIALEYEFRTIPPVQTMKKAVESGELGDIKAFSLYHFRTPFRRDKWNKWIQKKEYSGGLIVEETCHWFDLARYITGKEIASVHCITNGDINTDFDFEDIAFINGTYNDGAIFQLSHSITGFDFSLQLTLQGTKKIMWCNFKETPYSSLDAGKTDYMAILTKGDVSGRLEDAEVTVYGDEATEPFAICQAVKDYASQVIHGLPHTATFEDGYLSLKAALLSQKSALNSSIEHLD